MGEYGLLRWLTLSCCVGTGSPSEMTAPLNPDAVRQLPPWAQAVVQTGVFAGACVLLVSHVCLGSTCRTKGHVTSRCRLLMDADAQANPHRGTGRLASRSCRVTRQST